MMTADEYARWRRRARVPDHDDAAEAMKHLAAIAARHQIARDSRFCGMAFLSLAPAVLQLATQVAADDDCPLWMRLSAACWTLLGGRWAPGYPCDERVVERLLRTVYAADPAVDRDDLAPAIRFVRSVADDPLLWRRLRAVIVVAVGALAARTGLRPLSIPTRREAAVARLSAIEKAYYQPGTRRRSRRRDA